MAPNQESLAQPLGRDAERTRLGRSERERYRAVLSRASRRCSRRFVRVGADEIHERARERLRVSQEKKTSGCEGLSDTAHDGSRHINREVHRHVCGRKRRRTYRAAKQTVVLDKVLFLKSDRRPRPRPTESRGRDRENTSKPIIGSLPE